jgi:FkbM family methyltransferase
MKYYLHIATAVIVNCSNWVEIFYKRFFNKPIKTIKLKNGLKISINGLFGSAVLSMFSEIWYDNFYNPEGFEIKEKEIVFDIGANNGFFSIYAASKATEGMVYAFEPVPYLAQQIRDSVLLNNFKNLKVENIAIGVDNPESVFYISKDHNGCHSLYERKGELEKIITKVVDLQKFCVEKNINTIDFLKLDCEGAEYEIINKDTIDFIKNTVDKISMEYHDDINTHTHSEIIEVLSSANFVTEISGGYIYAKNGNK